MSNQARKLSIVSSLQQAEAISSQTIEAVTGYGDHHQAPNVGSASGSVSGQAPKGVDGGGGGGDDGDMYDRLKQLENAVSVIEAKMPDLATNDGVDARLSRTETKIILWVVGAVVATGLASKFLSPAAPSQPSAPIVIQVPAQSAPSVQQLPTPASSNSGTQK